MPLVVSQHFDESLVSWQPPERFLGPLGHSVSPAAPSGVVDGTVASCALRRRLNRSAAPDPVRPDVPAAPDQPLTLAVPPGRVRRARGQAKARVVENAPAHHRTNPPFSTLRRRSPLRVRSATSALVRRRPPMDERPGAGLRGEIPPPQRPLGPASGGISPGDDPGPISGRPVIHFASRLVGSGPFAAVCRLLVPPSAEWAHPLRPGRRPAGHAARRHLSAPDHESGPESPAGTGPDHAVRATGPDPRRHRRAPPAAGPVPRGPTGAERRAWSASGPSSTTPAASLRSRWRPPRARPRSGRPAPNCPWRRHARRRPLGEPHRSPRRWASGGRGEPTDRGTPPSRLLEAQAPAGDAPPPALPLVIARPTRRHHPGRLRRAPRLRWVSPGRPRGRPGALAPNTSPIPSPRCWVTGRRGRGGSTHRPAPATPPWTPGPTVSANPPFVGPRPPAVPRAGLGEPMRSLPPTALLLGHHHPEPGPAAADALAHPEPDGVQGPDWRPVPPDPAQHAGPDRIEPARRCSGAARPGIRRHAAGECPSRAHRTGSGRRRPRRASARRARSTPPCYPEIRGSARRRPRPAPPGPGRRSKGRGSGRPSASVTAWT